jgi:hypothetical protein
MSNELPQLHREQVLKALEQSANGLGDLFWRWRCALS